MKYLKKFEGFLSIFKSKHDKMRNDTLGLRISLDEKAFIDLCQTGIVRYEGSEFPIDSDKFADLISGEIINVDNAEICLQDIGHDRISNHIKKSKIY